MTNNTSQASSTAVPYKSVAIALIFSVVLGPIGLLYASFWGGFFMILLGMVIVSNKYIFPMILMWLICCVWSVRAVESYNKNLLKLSLLQR